MKNDLISIIVPVYNAEPFLGECIDSLIGQTYNNIEIILIDDGSKDNSLHICNEYSKKDKRIKVFHIDNAGVSNARNYGISHSNGQWITFVDSDDFIENDYCEALIKVVGENTDLVIGRTISFVNNKKLNDYYKGGIADRINNQEQKKELYKSILVDNHKTIKYPHISTCSAKLFRKEIINRYNLQYDIKMKYYEDAIFNMIFINQSREIVMIDAKIYNYRMNILSATNKFNSEMINQYDYVYKKLENLCNEFKINIETYFDYFKIKNLNTILTNYFKSNKYDKIFIRDNCNKIKKSLTKIKLSDLPKRRKMLVVLYKLRLYYLIYVVYKNI